jgi:hypothetical protein
MDHIRACTLRLRAAFESVAVAEAVPVIFNAAATATAQLPSEWS